MMDDYSVVLEETEEDRVIAEIDDDWLSISVYFKSTEADRWIKDPESGVTICADGVKRLLKFMKQKNHTLFPEG